MSKKVQISEKYFLLIIYHIWSALKQISLLNKGFMYLTINKLVYYFSLFCSLSLKFLRIFCALKAALIEVMKYFDIKGKKCWYKK